MNEHLTLIKKAKDSKNMVVVYRDEMGAAYYAGFPVLLSPQLAVLQKESGFRLDGYVAMRPGDVTYAEQYDDNPFCKRALVGERVYDAVKTPDFPAADWKQLVEGIIKTFGGWLSVECEASEQTVYYVGMATEVTSEYLTVRRVDADGGWHDQPASLPLDEITLITFGDNYLSVFAKYCER